VIVNLAVTFSTVATEDFIKSIMPILLQNLMEDNNTFTVDGVSYPAAIDMIFEKQVPAMNGSLISLDNVIACMYHTTTGDGKSFSVP